MKPVLIDLPDGGQVLVTFDILDDVDVLYRASVVENFYPYSDYTRFDPRMPMDGQMSLWNLEEQ